jgi:hypothetical protein
MSKFEKKTNASNRLDLMLIRKVIVVGRILVA